MFSWAGAVHGIENILGTTDNPVRAVLNKASEIAVPRLPLLYILTVVAPDNQGCLKIMGLFAGDDIECFRQAAALSHELRVQKHMVRQQEYLPDTYDDCRRRRTGGAGPRGQDLR